MTITTVYMKHLATDAPHQGDHQGDLIKARIKCAFTCLVHTNNSTEKMLQTERHNW